MQGATVNIPQMDIMDFYHAMKTHCKNAKAKCENCCMRLFCYTPPCEKTDSMMEKIISFLALSSEHNRTESDNHSVHHSEPVQMPCPCNMDMSNALGYEPH